jgi:hypothetical protein
VAEALGLPGNAPAAARASTNKRLARDRFSAAGLPVPWFVDLSTADLDDRRIQFPCVVKPIGLSGSRGVIRADTPRQLDSAVARVRALLLRKDVRAASRGLEDTILVEGFIEGREFAIEGVLADGVLRAFAIFDKPDPLDGPFFEETIYVTPSNLPIDSQAAVLDHVQRAATALGLTEGPLHAECRVGPGGVFMLEVAARPIGGLCARVLQFDDSDITTAGGDGSSKVSLEEVLLLRAAGRDISGHTREAQAAGVMMIPIPKRGLLKRVDGIETAAAVPYIEAVTITAKKDQLIERLPESGSYLGFVFARGGQPADLVRALKEAHRRLRIEVHAPLTIVNS